MQTSFFCLFTVYRTGEQEKLNDMREGKGSKKMTQISEKAREYRKAYMREYMRAYKAKNREKLREQEREHYKLNKAQHQARHARYWERRAEQAEQEG